ncbi:MAG: hypothetical protein HY719_18035 [Planctomycetes bacterium]|nr:hypothetical protein [Planctomycetota bacterium]
MPDATRILIHYEGVENRPLLQYLDSRRFLPEGAHLADEDAGSDTLLLHQAAPMIRKAGAAIVLADMNQSRRNVADLGKWLLNDLHRNVPGSSWSILDKGAGERVVVAVSPDAVQGDHMACVAAIAAGLPEERWLDQHWDECTPDLDDYILRLVLKPDLWHGQERPLRGPYKEKIAEISALVNQMGEERKEKKEEVKKRLGEHGRLFPKSTDLLSRIRGLVDYRAGAVSFTGAIVALANETYGRERFASFFEPLLSDFDAACRTVRETISVRKPS